MNDGLVNSHGWRTLNRNTPHWVEFSFPLPVTARSAHIYSGIDEAPALANFKVQYFSGGELARCSGFIRCGQHVHRA